MTHPVFTTRYRDKAAVPIAGFSLVELLVVITIVGILLGMLLPAVQAAREASRRTSCSNNLKQLGVALHSYHAQHGRFPAGSPLHRFSGRTSISWRVLILPFMEESNTYQQIEPRPDGGATNWAARTRSIAAFQCPSAARIPENNLVYQPSHYCGVMGAGRNDRRVVLEHDGCGDIHTDGVFYPGSRTRIAQIEDGTSHTLAIGERTYFLSDWMFGAEWEGGIPPKKICTGSSNNVRYPINADLSQFEKILANDLFFGSNHPDGAQFCFADGSVNMLADSTNFTVFEDMATIAGGEIIP
jgi:prepilin-type N-terminal cleavage/methylation domain-containing protein/prepilin-type processing-associated H-X9-DG protein